MLGIHQHTHKSKQERGCLISGAMHEIMEASQVAQWMQEIEIESLGREDPLEEGMGTHSSILTWGIPWTEEPGELQSMGL